MYRIPSLVGLLIATLTAWGQVVTVDPPYPTLNQAVTITYHADRGNQALVGASQVYMHTGVIVQGQPGWQYVQGNWGTADANVVMSPNGSNTWTKTITINSFYGLPANTNVIQLAFVFRNATGSIVGRENDGSDIFVNIIAGQPDIQNPPLGVVDGINYISDTSMILQLFAPSKQFVYVIGDFNNWQKIPASFCKRNAAGNRWWLQVDNLVPGQEYRFQYSIDAEDLRVADIYAQKVLDPWNDQWISPSTYPGLIPYPHGQTSEIVSVLKMGQQPYNWEVPVFFRPPIDRLVIYELHVRDFSAKGSFQGVIDSLDYLQRLGINAIEFMPVNEFEGNTSWGYNPSFYFAIDKAYGPAEDFKKLVDECHKRGIAVILDVVYNHSFGQNPQVRMYSQNGAAGPVTSQNPWFNVNIPHPFGIGFDYNHDSPHTQAFVKRNMHYWLQEFKVDGFRFDMSKGITNTWTGGNVNAWSAYDQSRVNHLFRMRSEVHEVDPYTYLILEHFADNSEETVLANGGFMLWGNNHYNSSEAVLGFGSNLNAANHQLRGWAFPNLNAYAESHDEERIMYKALQFGNQSNPNHNVRDLGVALRRMEALAAITIPLVGPKMMWQFGELGYDVSIFQCPNGTNSYDCKMSPKPARWDYYFEPDRQRLYKVWAAINKLKTQYPAFSSTNYNYDVWGFGKRLIIQHPSMDVVIMANFSVSPISMIPGFTRTGVWYDYFTGSSIIENNLSNAFLLQPGEYRIYTTEPLPTPNITVNQVAVTFRVDMSGQPIDVANGGVSVSGNFNGFTKEAMTHAGNGIYTLTKTLVEGRPLEYKFRNGNAYENVAGSCTVGAPFNNRSFKVPASAVTLAAVCYASCSPCASPPVCNVDGGTISTAQGTTVCVGTGSPKTVAVSLSGAVGPNRIWALVDNAFNIVSVRPNNANFNLDLIAPGDYRIYHMSYGNDVVLQGITNGSQLQGCFDLSNFITVRLRAQPNGGTITTTSPTTICVGDGVPDVVSVSLSGNSGALSRFGVVVLPSGNIVLSQASPNFNLDGLTPGNYALYHLSYQDNTTLQGATTAANLQGCYAVSNAIAITTQACPTVSASVQPNPTAGSTRFTLQSDEGGEAYAELYDSAGKLVKQVVKQTLLPGQSFHTWIDTGELPAGIYLIRYSVEGEGGNTRLVVQR